MRKLLLLLTMALAACGVGGLMPLAAQVRLSTLPRVTSTNGLADSSLFLCNDSTNTSTKACTFFSMRKRLQFKQWDSLVVLRLNLAGGTVFGTPTWLSQQAFAVNQRVDSTTGAARSQKLTTIRTIWGQNFDGTAAVTGALSGASTGNFSGLLTSVGVTSTGNVTVSGSNVVPNTDNAGQIGTSSLRFAQVNGSAGHMGADVAGSAAKLVVGDGTALSSNDAAASTFLGQLTSNASASTGTQLGSQFTLKATAAGASTYQALRGYSWAAHTSGTLTTLTGVVGVADVAGSGGTVTNVDAIRAQGVVGTGATATNFNGLTITAPSGAGTVGTLRGINIGNMGAGAAQFAITTGTGLIQVGDEVITAATTTSRASLRLTSGTAPSSPVAGDVYYDGTNTFINSSGLSVTGVVGTATNDNAAAGRYGEYLSHATVVGSAIGLTTGTTVTVDSVSLTAGDWDVTGVVGFGFGTTTSYTSITGGFSTTRSVIGASDANTFFATPAAVPTASAPTWTLPTVRFSVNATTKVYLVSQASFTVSTLATFGTIRARRVR